MRTLCLLVCEHFQKEVEMIAQEFEGVTVKTFPGRCGKGFFPPAVADLSVFSPEGHESICLYCRCYHKDMQMDQPTTHFQELEECSCLLASPRMVDKYLAEGGYLLTPGMLAHWQEKMLTCGFDQHTATEFFTETLKKLVLLDSGVAADSEELIRAFSNFTGLPYEIIPVGLDHVRLVLSNIILKWQLDQQKTRNSDLLNGLQQQITDYAMAMDLTTSLTGLVDEEGVIGKLLELFSILFAPSRLVYYPADGAGFGRPVVRSGQDIPQDILNQRLAWYRRGEGWAELENGFLLKVQHQGERYGLVEVGKILFPQHKTHYLNLAINVSDVCALAISNARNIKNLFASQRLAELGTLAAGVAHEINTPLQVITGTSDSLLHKCINQRYDEALFTRRLELLSQSAWRVAEIIRSLLAYARAEAHENERHDLNQIVGDTLLLVEHQFSSRSNVTIEPILADIPLHFFCDRNKITQIIINLLSNSMDAMPRGGLITLKTSLDAQQKSVILSLADNGSGIPKEIQEQMYDPFFTTKPVGKGSGLGLSVVMGIVRSHGGEITVDSTPEKGTLFTLKFPQDGMRESKKDPGNKTGRYRDI